MSAFAIFAFVLTIAYFIYYAVVIYMDMTRKDGQKSDTEDIDIPGQAANVPDDDPTQVEETEGGGYKVTSPEKGAGSAFRRFSRGSKGKIGEHVNSCPSEIRAGGLP